MAVAQQFCVRWNSHLGSLGAAFPQLLAGGRFVDVTLACEGRQLSCHRLVLAACSGFFESLLGESPCKHPIIILKDVRFWELQALVDFMYKGEVNVTQDGLQDLLKCAEALQIRGLSGADSAFKNLPTSIPTPLPKPPEPENKPIIPISHQTKLVPTPFQSANGNLSNIQKPFTPTMAATALHNNDFDKHSQDSCSGQSDDMYDDDMIKEEYCIEESANKSQSGNYIKVKQEIELFGENIDRNLMQPDPVPSHNGDTIDETKLFYPPQLKYNKDVMMILPKPIKTEIPSFSEQFSDLNSAGIYGEIIIEPDFPENVTRNQRASRNIDETLKKVITENFNTKIPQYSTRSILVKKPKLGNGGGGLIANSVHFMSNKVVTRRLLPSQGAVVQRKVAIPRHTSKSLAMTRDSFYCQANQRPTCKYSNEALYKALMEVKGGISIYKASQVYNIPRKTLRNWMKRWDIKSRHPMPKQLRQFADKMKHQNQQI